MSSTEVLNHISSDGAGHGAGYAIQSFVLDTLDVLGAAVEIAEYGVYDVLLPGEQFQRITFDPEISQERDDCELVTYGTPFLESMIGYAKTLGRLQVRRLDTRSDPPQNLDDKVTNVVHFVKCKPPKVSRTWTEEGFLLLCQFVVTFHGDEVTEACMTTVIDCQTLADVTHLRARLDEHWFTHNADPGLYPISTPYRLTESVSRACRALQPQIEQVIGRIQLEHRAAREDELAKSRHYYETTILKLEKQLSSTLDAAKAERIRKKIEATILDRDHRMEDIARAYEVTVDVHLDQAILYRLPIVCVEVQLQQRADCLLYHI